MEVLKCLQSSLHSHSHFVGVVAIFSPHHDDSLQFDAVCKPVRKEGGKDDKINSDVKKFYRNHTKGL